MNEPTTEEIDTTLSVIDHYREKSDSSVRSSVLSGAESIIRQMSEHDE